MVPGAQPRDPLPSGTVTLLFADVEGSTRLLHALGDRFVAARSRLREVVREATDRRGGREVDWAGDGVFLAFEGARDAQAAAIEIQERLAAEPWPAGEELRLRIGLHTGEPQLVDEGYVGVDVVVAARICAAAHGGQIVVSRTTRELAGEEPADGVSYRPLGRHRLKDLPSAEQLFQLVAPGLRDEFPPLRTLGASGLPTLHPRLVGRDAALNRIQDLLRRPDVRLVTITGPGGAGKSRLALEVAAAAVDRPVHLVPLAPVTDADLVPEAIARSLGIRESPGRSAIDLAAETLAGSGALVFLDNLEHLAPAAIHVAELLERAPDVDVLATSRAPLRLLGEHVFPLEPLSADDAATLFVELAAARGVVLKPDTLASVREICRRLDGLPLAIELVAARLVVFPPTEIVRALESGLALELEGPLDLPERQRTLRAALDWSYGLLSESQRDLHGALAVFANGALLDDARAVSDADPRTFVRDLEALVAWSLARSDASDTGVRISMLETVREHAIDRLREEGSLDGLRDRHADRFLELAFTAQSGLTGDDQAGWLEVLEEEHDNVRAALDWALASGRSEVVLRAISALERFWLSHGHVGEARRRLARALDGGAGASDDVRADSLWTAARLADAQSDWRGARPLLEEALALYRARGRGRETVFSLCELTTIAVRQDELERASVLCSEALSIARDLGDARALSGVLVTDADVARLSGDRARALASSEEALELRLALGDTQLVTDSTYHLGVAAFVAGDLDRARDAFEDALDLAAELGDSRYTAAALCMLGSAAVLRGEPEFAEERLRTSLAMYTELGDDRSRAECLCALGGCAALVGRPEDACRLFGAADALRGEGPLEYAEPAIESRFAQELVGALGRERVDELRADGRRRSATGAPAGLEIVVSEAASQ